MFLLNVVYVIDIGHISQNNDVSHIKINSARQSVDCSLNSALLQASVSQL